MATAESTLEARSFEDELLDALESLRQAGGLSCGQGAPAASAPWLRLDPRLTCAARVLAADMNATRARSLVDSEGRASQERFRAAGYVSRSWAEGFAMGDSPSSALSAMVSDMDFCPHVVDTRYVDVGVARVGDVSVISLGAE